MFLAPSPTLRATVTRVASGMRGVVQTLGVMRRLVNEGRVDPTIRQAATNLVFLVPERFDHTEVAKILEWCQSSLRYTKDVNDVETISTAAKTLAGRLGDCDDQTVLFCALCESIGYPTRFAVAAYDVAHEIEHVYAQVQVEGVWLDADPTERYPLGTAPPGALTILIERGIQ